MSLLERYLDSDNRVFPMATNQITLKQIRSVEKSLGIQLPSEYVAHLLAEDCNLLCERGLYIEVKEDIWERPKEGDVGSYWSFLYGIHTYTASDLSDDWMKLESVGQQFRQETGIKAVPVLKIINDPDVYCVDESRNIKQFNHETNELLPTNMDFWQIFELELKELSRRKDQKNRI